MCRAFNVSADILCQAMQPNMVSYCALVSSCEEGNKMRRAFDVSAAKLRQAMKPDTVSYSALVTAREKGRDLVWHPPYARPSSATPGSST